MRGREKIRHDFALPAAINLARLTAPRRDGSSLPRDPLPRVARNVVPFEVTL